MIKLCTKFTCTEFILKEKQVNNKGTEPELDD